MPDTETLSSQPNRRPTWTTVLSMLTALVAIGTVTLHVLGSASNRAYLQHWGIDAGVFPKAADLVLIDGYYGLVNQSAVGFLTIVTHFGVWALAATALSLYLFFLFSDWEVGDGTVARMLAKVPVRMHRLARYLLGALVIAVVVPFLMVAGTAVMILPDIVGTNNGKWHAERETADFLKGCQKSKQACVQLLRGGQQVASGYVIEGSTLHIAVFDVDLQRARVIPRDQIELVAGRPPLASAPAQ